MINRIFVLMTVVLGSMWALAVPNEQIAALRQRAQGDAAAISDADRAIIERFWQVALDAMLLSEDPATVVSIRRQLQQEKGDAASPYSAEYIKVALSHLKTDFMTVEKWDESDRKTLMLRNLMVLTAQLQSPLLAELGLERLGHSDDVVRYWAAKAVCNPAMAQYLNTAVGDQSKVFVALTERIAQEPQMDVLRTIITFAAMVNRDEARGLLIAAAERRIAMYQGWTVVNEPFDTVLLKTIGMIVLNEPETPIRAKMAQKFAELFSLVFQRYMVDPSPLTDEQRTALLAVIAEVDNQIFTRLMGNQQTGIMRAIRSPQWRTALEREYETYFGGATRAGELGTRWKFTYDGKTAPPKLAAKP